MDTKVSTVPLDYNFNFTHVISRVTRQYNNASPLRVCVEHAYSCHVIYTSRGRYTRGKYTRWKYTLASTRLEAVKLTYVPHHVILLVDQHNFTHLLFSCL